MKRSHMLFLGALALIAAGLVAWDYYRPRQPAPVPIVPIEDDREYWRQIVAQVEVDSARALADYRPKAQQQITDLGADAEELLRGLPGVVDVKGMSVEKPTHRIIHFRGFQRSHANGSPLTRPPPTVAL